MVFPIILERLIWLIPMLIGVTLFSFTLLYVIPGDPILVFVGERASPETISQLRELWGLDKPLLVQYVNFLTRILRGDLGVSYRSGRPVLQLIRDRLDNTLALALVSLIIGVLVGITLGLIPLFLQNRWGKAFIMVFSLLSLAIPVYLWALGLLWIFAIKLQWLPAGGNDSWRHYILPGLSLGLRQAGSIARYTYQGVAEVWGSDYIRTARGKGLSVRQVMLKHALRNALIPLVTLIGLDFASYLNGAVLTETVFAWPGIGRLAASALLQRDFSVIQGIVLLSAVIYVLVNLLLDILYILVDPRVHYR